jgi:hypothetical protein
MDISFIGITGKKAQRLKDASVFYAELLMDKRIVNNLDLEIKVLDDYEFLGHCLPEDDAKKSRYFMITLQKDNKEMLRTLAHEMVHLKQYATGELSIDDDAIYWYGETWKPKGKQHKYFDSPWELEAYGRDFGLYYRWLEYEERLNNV